MNADALAVDLDAVAIRHDGRAGDVGKGGMGRHGGYRKQAGNEAAHAASLRWPGECFHQFAYLIAQVRIGDAIIGPHQLKRLKFG